MSTSRRFRNLNRDEIDRIQKELGRDYTPLILRTVDSVLEYLNQTSFNENMDDSIKEFFIKTLSYIIATDPKLDFLIKYMEKQNGR